MINEIFEGHSIKCKYPLWTRISEGVEKAISEGLCASAPLIFEFFLSGKAKIS
jgi:hypothetical protein